MIFWDPLRAISDGNSHCTQRYNMVDFQQWHQWIWWWKLRLSKKREKRKRQSKTHSVGSNPASGTTFFNVFLFNLSNLTLTPSRGSMSCNYCCYCYWRCSYQRKLHQFYKELPKKRSAYGRVRTQVIPWWVILAFPLLLSLDATFFFHCIFLQ